MRPKNSKFTDEDAMASINMTAKDAAKTYGVGMSIVRRTRKRLGLTTKRGRPKQNELVEKICPTCNAKFVSVSEHCSIKCYHESRVYVTSQETKDKIREKAKTRWKHPTKNMIAGVEKRTLSQEDLVSYKKYRNRLKTLTEKTYRVYKQYINPHDHQRGVAGKEGVYHLDHIIPARFGYDNNIPPDVLAEKENLQMLPWRDNIVKGRKCETLHLGTTDVQ